MGRNVEPCDHTATWQREGRMAFETVTTYVMQTIGPVCTQINDV